MYGEVCVELREKQTAQSSRSVSCFVEIPTPHGSRGGPIGAGYEATSSGWFDSRTFQIWFVTIFLANVVSKPGVKVLIGDNLHSCAN